MHGPMNIKLVFHIYLGTIHKACSLITNMYTLCGRNAEFLIMMCIYIYIYIYIYISLYLMYFVGKLAVGPILLFRPTFESLRLVSDRQFQN